MTPADTDAGLDAAHPVRARAWLDYTPSLVAVDFEAIGRLPRPQALGKPAPLLQGTVLATYPPAYLAALLAMGVLNYQFWALEANGTLRRYAHDGKVGAQAMMAVFFRAWLAAAGERVPGPTLSHIVTELRRQLAGDGLAMLFGDIPEPDSRRALLEEVLDADRLGLAVRLLLGRMEYTQELSWEDAQLLARLFPRGYGGDAYLKKAQLVLMFAAAQWNAQHAGRRCLLNLTAAADYQLPRVLRALDLLHYDEELAHRIDRRVPLLAESLEECALRAATVVACDLLASQFDVGVEVVDNWLWTNRHAAGDAPFHLTLTTNY